MASSDNHMDVWKSPEKVKSVYLTHTHTFQLLLRLSHESRRRDCTFVAHHNSRECSKLHTYVNVVLQGISGHHALPAPSYQLQRHRIASFYERLPEAHLILWQNGSTRAVRQQSSVTVPKVTITVIITDVSETTLILAYYY